MASLICPKPSCGRLNRGHFLAQGISFCLPVGEGSGSGAIYDVAGRDQHGVLNNFPASPWTGSPFGWAIAFDGVDDYVQGTKVSDTFGSGKFTIAVLFKAGSTGAAQPLFTKEDSITRAINTYVQSSGVLRFELFDGSNNPTLDTASTWNDGLWHLAVWTRNGGALAVYVDGKLENSISTSLGDCSLSTALYRLGRRTWAGGSGTYLSGGIAGVWVWEGVELKAEQVARFTADPFVMLRTRPIPLKALAAILYTRTVSSASTAVSLLSRQTKANRAGTSSAGSTAAKQAGKPVSTASTLAALIASSRVRLLSLVATVTGSALVRRLTGKSTAGTLSASAITAKAGTRAVSASAGTSGATNRQFPRTVSAGVTSLAAAVTTALGNIAPTISRLRGRMGTLLLRGLSGGSGLKGQAGSDSVTGRDSTEG